MESFFNKINKKSLKIENSFWKFIFENIYPISFLLISFLAIATRVLFLDYVSGDYVYFLEPWFDTLESNGGLLGIKAYNGNYNYPYITLMAILTYLPVHKLQLIKFLTIAFDYVLAIACKKLVKNLTIKSKNSSLYSLVTYAIILFLPTVVLNGSYWGQCDSIYTSFIVISLLYLIKEKYFKAFVFLGVAFSLKLQFVFVLPLYILVYISKRKFPIYYFLLIPIMDLILCLPAMIFGKSLNDCINMYFVQAGTYNYLSMIFPGVYDLILNHTASEYVEYVSGIGEAFIYFVILLFFITFIMVVMKNIRIEKEDVLEFALWSILVCTFFLPNMHERYLFTGDVISVIYFMTQKDWKKIYIPISVNAVSLYGYARLLFGTSVFQIQTVSLLNFVVVILMTVQVSKKMLGDNCKEKQI